ncbi:MAG: chromosomal replication initiator protein DnaA [Armatimonadota bacterium]
MTADTLWQNALAALESAVGRLAYETIFRCIRPLSLDQGELVLGVNNQFAKEWLESRYLPTVTHCLHQAAEEPIALKVTVCETSTVPPPAPEPRRAPAPASPVVLDQNFGSTPLNPRYTFDAFVEGNSNRFAHALALHVARGGGGGVDANPLFIWGGVGLGKTHLMQAIAHHVLQNDPRRRVVYVQAETFVNQILRAIGDRTTSEFRAAYRNVDVWLVDDVQFIAAKEGTRSEEEFFHTFNTLHQTNRQIVMSSDQPPRGLRILDERLRSRFESGAIADIKRPDVLERIAILQNKASLAHADVPMDVLEHIASITWNIRTIEGALTSLLAYSSLEGESITLEMAEEVLKDYSTGQGKHQVSIEHIQKLVSDRFGVSREDLSSKKRSRNIVFPRQVAMYLIRELTSSSLMQIGKAFGGRDHSTVLHACGKINELMSTDDATMGLVNDLLSQAQTS